MTARRLPRSVRRSAAPIGARGVSDPGRRSSILICRILQSSDEIRVPPARRSRRPLRVPPAYHPPSFNFLPPSYIFYGVSCLGGAQNSNSGRLRAQILETLCELCSLGAQNPKSGHLWTQILDTLCKSCCLGAQNSKSEHFGPILLRILLQAIDQFD